MPDPSRRLAVIKVRKALIVFFTLVFLTSVWPIYPLFSRIRPLILGMPFSLAFLVGLVLLSFGVLLAFYLWEDGEAD